jgi:hypothetical protein
MAPAQPVPQTSVRVPREALDALDHAARDAGKSRDATMRNLLANYVRVQSARDPGERLTHLTTVLRLPRLPPGRNREDPRPHLRLRVADTLKIAALQHAFLLPGQSPRHGHHDYAGRPLTDIVMTAIELAERIRLPGLDGLPHMLPQRTALGLWRLAVAATLTPAERRAIWGSEVADLAPVLTEEDVAWHHPWRFEVAELLLRRIYDQPDADVAENVDMLHDQTEAFVDLLAAVRRADFSTAWLTDGLPYSRSNVDGRGGAAVWRAQRKLSLEALGGWATGPRARGEVNVVPPDWNLKLPLNWRIRTFGHLEPVPAPCWHIPPKAESRCCPGARGPRTGRSTYTATRSRASPPSCTVVNRFLRNGCSRPFSTSSTTPVSVFRPASLMRSDSSQSTSATT